MPYTLADELVYHVYEADRWERAACAARAVTDYENAMKRHRHHLELAAACERLIERERTGA